MRKKLLLLIIISSLGIGAAVAGASVYFLSILPQQKIDHAKQEVQKERQVVSEKVEDEIVPMKQDVKKDNGSLKKIDQQKAATQKIFTPIELPPVVAPVSIVQQIQDDPLIKIEKCKISAENQSKAKAELAKKQSFQQFMDANLCSLPSAKSTAGMDYKVAITNAVQNAQARYDSAVIERNNAAENLASAKQQNSPDLVSQQGRRLAIAEGKLRQAQIDLMSLEISMSQENRAEQAYVMACYAEGSEDAKSLYNSTYNANYNNFYQVCLSK